MSQEKYIQDILRRFSMEDCKPVSTPLLIGSKLSKTDIWSEEDGPKPPYRELVGSLMYLSVATRPDISHAASVLSQYNDCFGKSHWIAAKRILRYLKKTAYTGIEFKPDGILKGFVDADWAGSLDDRSSFTGYTFVMNNSPISWESRKQRTVALSSTEAEYMALCDASKEAVYLLRLLKEVSEDSPNSLQLFNDNMGAQRLVVNPVYHARTKYIDIRHHYIREVMNSGRISLNYLPTEEMPADVLTKVLSKGKHWHCNHLMGVSDFSESVNRACLEGAC